MKKERRGKWSRDPWIRILEILAAMSKDERRRCLHATLAFFENRRDLK